MIVGSFFDGDEDREVAWRQHDVYRQSLNIIMSTCNKYTLFAEQLLNCKAPEGWGEYLSCDHRTLQWAHDILAAAWRYKNDFRQLELPIEINPVDRDVTPLSPGRLEELWLGWLRDEVNSWVWSFDIINQVQLILSNQNQPIGNVAESRLSIILIDRFYETPWNSDYYSIFQESLLEKEKVLEDLSELMDEEKIVEDCECVKKGRVPCNTYPCVTLCEQAEREGWGPL